MGNIIWGVIIVSLCWYTARLSRQRRDLLDTLHHYRVVTEKTAVTRLEVLTHKGDTPIFWMNFDRGYINLWNPLGRGQTFFQTDRDIDEVAKILLRSFGVFEEPTEYLLGLTKAWAFKQETQESLGRQISNSTLSEYIKEIAYFRIMTTGKVEARHLMPEGLTAT